MLYKFSCPLPPTLNQQIGDARGNKYKSSVTKKKWTELVADIVTDAPRFPGVVYIEFEWHIKNWNSDSDNIEAAQKFIMDGLKLAGVIQDDSLKFIHGPKLHSYVKTKSDSHVFVKLSDRKLFEIVRLDDGTDG